jgi:hypothetical protein
MARRSWLELELTPARCFVRVHRIHNPFAPAHSLRSSCSLAGGALSKLKLESSGALTALYQTKLQGGEKVRNWCRVTY